MSAVWLPPAELLTQYALSSANPPGDSHTRGAVSALSQDGSGRSSDQRPPPLAQLVAVYTCDMITLNLDTGTP